MFRFCARLASLAVLCTCTGRAASVAWGVAKDSNFDVYSQSGVGTARHALIDFEELRLFFEQLQLDPQASEPLRVVVFQSAQDFERYRLRTYSDAAFLNSGNRNYIEMLGASMHGFGIAAHEYSHFVLHSRRLPEWLSEGLAEVFSTVRIGANSCSLGGAIPGRVQFLNGRRWIPLAELVAISDASHHPANRDTTDLFYAESWALADMLAFAPEYHLKIADLIQRFSASERSSSPMDGVGQLAGITRRSPEQIWADLHRWVSARGSAAVTLPGVSVPAPEVRASEVSELDSRIILADLLLAGEQLDRAAGAYRDIELQSPRNAQTAAALGVIAFRRGNRQEAERYWGRAIESGINDPDLCFQYAQIADEDGVPPDLVRAALERALALKPDFDDARYKLAFLQSNAGDFDGAVHLLRAMRVVTPARQFAYWYALANALGELDRRDEADSAAQEALRHAGTPEEQIRARQLSYLARTDLTVQFARDANGNLQLVTARKLHDSPDWNPFVEPTDDLRHIAGKMDKIVCANQRIVRIIFRTAAGPVTTSVPDPSHVLMRNAPSEFLCGTQDLQAVMIDYARTSPAKNSVSDGILRGITFPAPAGAP